MKLDFKGIITKKDLESDLSNLDPIMENNDYAIVVDDGVGKFVIFSIDYVKYNLESKKDIKPRNKLIKSPFTLVESMIQTLEEMPEKKTTAIMLSSLVSKYYGREASPVTIRTRAEENANQQNEVDYFIIEPGNVIGLAKNSSFILYMHNKIKRAVEFEINKLFKNDDFVELNLVFYKIQGIFNKPNFQKYTRDYTNKDIRNIISELKQFRIDNNYIFHNDFL